MQEKEVMKKVIDKIEENLSLLCCELDKIVTLSKVLNQTLVEDSDFKLGDSQNLCALIIQEINSSKSMVTDLEKLFSSYKTSCR